MSTASVTGGRFRATGLIVCGPPGGMSNSIRSDPGEAFAELIAWRKLQLSADGHVPSESSARATTYVVAAATDGTTSIIAANADKARVKRLAPMVFPLF